MITIVTGKINEGKTTKLKLMYHEDKKGDGFIAVKKMDGINIHSFLATKLSTKEQKVLMLHKNYYSESFISAGKIGPYLINLFTLSWVEKSIEKMIKKKVEPIYLDEIGVLELDGYGYDRILRKLIESNLDLVITMRSDLVEKIKEHYHLKDVEVIRVSR
jgi:nucleoside-triphosphatase THEP1